jgi:hypothetical protein
MMNPNQDSPCTPIHGTGDMHQKKKPDPPGGIDFVCQVTNAPFDCCESMSTMTNPHGPNLSVPMILALSTTNASFSQNANRNNDDEGSNVNHEILTTDANRTNDDDGSNVNHEILTTDLISNSTNDPNDPCFSYLDEDGDSQVTL